MTRSAAAAADILPSKILQAISEQKQKGTGSPLLIAVINMDTDKL